MTSILTSVRFAVQGIQSELNFESWADYPQFNKNRVRTKMCCSFMPTFSSNDAPFISQGLGRVGLIGCLLGISWGVHFTVGVLFTLCKLNIISIEEIERFLGEERLLMAIQWCLYVVGISTFHLSEFFTTALYNPSVATADSYIVNHSTTYTVAAIVSHSFLHAAILHQPATTGTDSTVCLS